MVRYLLQRVLYAIPTMFGVTLLCFALLHLAPGDPLSSVLPADASQALRNQMMALYGFDRPLPVQYVSWLWRALHGDLGMSISTGDQVSRDVFGAVANSLRLALVATLLGFVFGLLFGFVGGYFRGSALERVSSVVSVLGVSVPHYWLAIILVIIFSVFLPWLPATGGGPDGAPGWHWDWSHVQYMVLPAVAMAVIPTGIIARTIRALVADILGQEFIVGLAARGLDSRAILLHVAKNVAPTALSVMGLQLGYLLGGSILIETIFSWPGTGFLLNTAIFQRDYPLLQGTILVLALLFVVVNVVVDALQMLIDPRIARA
ncbi:ABC transporter permease [Burkholderia sp. WAC0059]|uniref:ABC transporter permease n=1 Tax=Burkholderia sp. WAC0059 TaxID=2066022 RepID=UPI000C7EA86E|nr:ABC transporter permease [Burkholderia sp. WAC0059]PLZ02277.1 ABC transporter permease [Burkholderia sp. WAC0059]